MRAALEVLVMPRYNVNKHTSLAVRLLELRRHFNTCTQCASAMKAKDHNLLCPYTKESILWIAIRWEANIPGRLAAAKSKDAHIFPCPDPNVHGPAYALSAEACVVVGITDRMF